MNGAQHFRAGALSQNRIVVGRGVSSGMCLPCGGRWICSADFESALSPTCSRQGVFGPTRRCFRLPGRVQLCDTAQRGGAATKGARVCDPQQLCRPPSVLTNPASRSLSTCCGSQSRAPQNRRGPRRLGQILIEFNSALRRAAKQVRCRQHAKQITRRAAFHV